MRKVQGATTTTQATKRIAWVVPEAPSSRARLDELRPLRVDVALTPGQVDEHRRRDQPEQGEEHHALGHRVAHVGGRTEGADAEGVPVDLRPEDEGRTSRGAGGAADHVDEVEGPERVDREQDVDDRER